MVDMKGTVTGIRAYDEFNPILSFDIKLDNECDKKIAFLNTISKVLTASPMKIFEVGKLIPHEAYIFIDANHSTTFTFNLNINRKSLNEIEKTRRDDVWFNIHMSILFMEVEEDWSPIRFRWKGLQVGDGICPDMVRIPESDWLKLRDDLGFGKMMIVEVREETYKVIETFRKEIRARDLDEAIFEAMLLALEKRTK